MIDILVIAVCAVIAGAESWVDMALYGQNKADWLGGFLALSNGIPAHDTFRRVFMLIDPESFDRRFTVWAQALATEEELSREVVAIDGKAVRGSADRRRDQEPLHIVSAWACERGLVLEQRQISDKSNEITAIPELLDTLDFKGCIVTLDAMDCQRAIAATVLERGADCLVMLKTTQGTMLVAVRDHCAETCFARDTANQPACDAFESHGRLVRRRVFSCPQAAMLEPLRDRLEIRWRESNSGVSENRSAAHIGARASEAEKPPPSGRASSISKRSLRDWPGLRTVVAVDCIRTISGSGRVEREIRYFLSSCTDNPEVPARAIRQHWGIENSLRWVLDVTFREDECRVRDRAAAYNFALLRKIAITLVRQHQASRASLRGRRKMAGWNNSYMRRVFTGFFHA